MSISLTAAANSAAQFIHALDSGESLSSQQITDALPIANRMLANWTAEQTQAINVLIAEQTKQFAKFVDAQAVEGAPLATRQAKLGQAMIDELAAVGTPLVASYTLAGGTYTVATYTAPAYTSPSFGAPSYTPGSTPQFADTTTPIALPVGVERAFVLNLGIEIAPQYDVDPTATLLKQAAEAKAAAFPVPNKIPVPATAGTETVQVPGVGGSEPAQQ